MTVSRSVLYVAPIDRAQQDRLRALFSGSPPFDPETTALDRHTVFMSEQRVAFLFEGEDPEAAVLALARDHDLQLQVMDLASAVHAPDTLRPVFDWRRGG
ncbi:MAG TPA: hypothetical protein VE777_12130 [Gaiellales bacterium]|nr:hypothetical protein [Gaiellales bacterium]